MQRIIAFRKRSELINFPSRLQIPPLPLPSSSKQIMTTFIRLFEVFSLGFFCGLIPGPVVTSLFTETIRRGWKSARRIVFIAALGELLMSIACVAFLSTINPPRVIFSALGVFGALLLLSISWDLWKIEEIKDEEPLFSSKRIFFVSLFNGMAWVFWLTVCTPQAVHLGEMLSGGQWLFIVLFESGWLSSTLILNFLFGLFRPYFQSSTKIHLFYRGIALFFVLFALRLGLESGQTILQNIP